jgi:putative DNA primase/helicase
MAEPNNLDTWGGFDLAVERATRNPTIEGVGFVTSADDPYTLLDLDGCLQDGEMCPWAVAWLKRFTDRGAYVEVSPSGTGLHVFVRGKLPGLRNVASNPGGTTVQAELYDRGRYFTVTGAALARPEKIGDAQSVIDDFYLALFPPKPRPKRKTGAPVDLTDDQLISKARKAGNGWKLPAVIMAATPTGTRKVKSCLSGISLGTVCP